MNLHDTSTPNRDIGLLYHPFAQKVTKALDECFELGYPLCIFEGYRSPERQDYLYEQGRTRPGKIVTQRQAWGSWHQYGLGCDVALYREGKWSWDFKYADIKLPFLSAGLQSLHPFEDGHFQLTGGLDIKYAADLSRNHGLPRLWMEISQTLK